MCDMCYSVHLMSFVVYFVYQISEEVAFYQGNRKEQAIINSALLRLVLLMFIITFILIKVVVVSRN